MSSHPWYIAPLGIKYYGTEVCYDPYPEAPSRDAELEKVFTIWQPDHYAEPFASEREIARGWTPEDGHDHVEDAQSYKMAVFLVNQLNSHGITLAQE